LKPNVCDKLIGNIVHLSYFYYCELEIGKVKNEKDRRTGQLWKKRLFQKEGRVGL
jgi:hypothetical protein